MDNYPDRRRTLTLVRTIPDSILERFAQDADELVRVDIARKRRLPNHLFEFLSTDSEEMVRNRIAWNARTPLAILEKLTSDVSQLVATTAIQRLGQRKNKEEQE